jgi:hypothetical protein
MKFTVRSDEERIEIQGRAEELERLANELMAAASDGSHVGRGADGRAFVVIIRED